MSEKDLKDKEASVSVDEEKRDFLFVTTAGLAVAGGAVTAFSLIDTMNPAKDVLALSTTEVDLSPVEEGQSLTVMWRVNQFLLDTELQVKLMKQIPPLWTN